MIYAMIDEFTPCLKDAKTGEFVQTEVVQIKRKSFLKKYNKKNGWYTNWESLADENEIYALVVEGIVESLCRCFSSRGYWCITSISVCN